MSKREEIQNRLVELCRELDLDQVYGILTGTDKKPSGRTCRYLTFCAARTIDGLIEIYGPSFIRIVSNRNEAICKSLDEAETHMRETYG